MSSFASRSPPGNSSSTRRIDFGNGTPSNPPAQPHPFGYYNMDGSTHVRQHTAAQRGADGLSSLSPSPARRRGSSSTAADGGGRSGSANSPSSSSVPNGGTSSYSPYNSNNNAPNLTTHSGIVGIRSPERQHVGPRPPHSSNNTKKIGRSKYDAGGMLMTATDESAGHETLATTPENASSLSTTAGQQQQQQPRLVKGGKRVQNIVDDPSDISTITPSPRTVGGFDYYGYGRGGERERFTAQQQLAATRRTAAAKEAQNSRSQDEDDEDGGDSDAHHDEKSVTRDAISLGTITLPSGKKQKKKSSSGKDPDGQQQRSMTAKEVRRLRGDMLLSEMENFADLMGGEGDATSNMNRGGDAGVMVPRPPAHHHQQRHGGGPSSPSVSEGGSAQLIRPPTAAIAHHIMNVQRRIDKALSGLMAEDGNAGDDSKEAKRRRGGRHGTSDEDDSHRQQAPSSPSMSAAAAASAAREVGGISARMRNRTTASNMRLDRALISQQEQQLFSSSGGPSHHRSALVPSSPTMESATCSTPNTTTPRRGFTGNAKTVLTTTAGGTHVSTVGSSLAGQRLPFVAPTTFTTTMTTATAPASSSCLTPRASGQLLLAASAALHTVGEMPRMGRSNNPTLNGLKDKYLYGGVGICHSARGAPKSRVADKLNGQGAESLTHYTTSASTSIGGVPSSPRHIQQQQHPATATVSGSGYGVVETPLVVNHFRINRNTMASLDTDMDGNSVPISRRRHGGAYNQTTEAFKHSSRVDKSVRRQQEGTLLGPFGLLPKAFDESEILAQQRAEIERLVTNGATVGSTTASTRGGGDGDGGDASAGGNANGCDAPRTAPHLDADLEGQHGVGNSNATPRDAAFAPTVAPSDQSTVNADPSSTTAAVTTNSPRRRSLLVEALQVTAFHPTGTTGGRFRRQQQHATPSPPPVGATAMNAFGGRKASIPLQEQHRASILGAGGASLSSHPSPTAVGQAPSAVPNIAPLPPFTTALSSSAVGRRNTAGGGMTLVTTSPHHTRRADSIVNITEFSNSVNSGLAVLPAAIIPIATPSPAQQALLATLTAAVNIEMGNTDGEHMKPLDPSVEAAILGTLPPPPDATSAAGLNPEWSDAAEQIRSIVTTAAILPDHTAAMRLREAHERTVFEGLRVQRAANGQIWSLREGPTSLAQQSVQQSTAAVVLKKSGTAATSPNSDNGIGRNSISINFGRNKGAHSTTSAGGDQQNQTPTAVPPRSLSLSAAVSGKTEEMLQSLQLHHSAHTAPDGGPLE